jgi:NitT/TauT family transport system substrate-binding protein
MAVNVARLVGMLSLAIIAGLLPSVAPAAASGAIAGGATNRPVRDAGAIGRVLPQTQRVTVATPSAGIFELPMTVAMARGFYQEANLEVTRVQMPPPVTVAALMAGEADFGGAIDAAVSANIGAGAPIKLVLGFAHRPLHVLMVRDPSIQTVADLRGRSVAVGALSGSSYNLARLALQANGLEAQTDVPLRALGESPQRLAALLSGQVPATLLDLAYVPEAERQGARVLLRLADLIEVPIGGLAVTESKLRDQPAQIQAMIQASLRGTRFMRENREETIAIMVQQLGLARDVAELTYDQGINSFTPDGVLPDSALQVMVDAAREATGHAAPVPLTQVADFSLARRAVP